MTGTQDQTRTLSQIQQALEKAKDALAPLLKWYEDNFQDQSFLLLSPEDQISAVILYLEANLSGSVIPYATAKSLGVSTRQFDRIIKRSDFSGLTDQQKDEYLQGETTILLFFNSISIRPPSGHTVPAWMERLEIYKQCLETYEAALLDQQIAEQTREIVASGSSLNASQNFGICLVPDKSLGS